MNTKAAQCSPWVCMKGFRSLTFWLPFKKPKNSLHLAICMAILFFQANFEWQFLVVVPAALNAGPLSALPGSQSAPKEHCSQQTGFKAPVP